MGNEMGNNNTSGLREEENSKQQDKDKSSQESVHADESQAQDHVIPEAQGKDENQKEKGLVPGDQASLDNGHTVVGREPEAAEGEDSEKQPPVVFKDSDNHAETNSLSFQNVKVDDQLEKGTSTQKENENTRNSVLTTTPALGDTPPQEIVDFHSYEHNFPKTSSYESEKIGIGSYFTNTSSSIDESVLSDSSSVLVKEVDRLMVKDQKSKEENVLNGEKFDVKDGEEMGEIPDKITMETKDLLVGFETQCNTEVPNVISPISTDSLEDRLQHKEPEKGEEEISQEMVLVNNNMPANDCTTVHEQPPHHIKSSENDGAMVIEDGLNGDVPIIIAHEEKPKIVAEIKQEEPREKSVNVEVNKKKPKCMFRSRSLPVRQTHRILTGSLLTDVSSSLSKTDLKEEETTETVPEAKTAENQSIPCVSGNEAHENIEKLSIELNPDNTEVHAHMHKSPSFGADLRIEARTQESDQTPLLAQDKPTEHSELYVDMPVEEKVVMLERSDTEKARTEFLGFLKEEEEMKTMITNQKQEADDLQSCLHGKKVVPSASFKGKEKRKARASLFGTCLCCATVIN